MRSRPRLLTLTTAVPPYALGQEEVVERGNLGGSIGLAVINTLIQQRAPSHVAVLVERLQAGDREAAQFVGLPLDRFTGQPLGAIDEETRELVAPLVEQAGLTLAINDAWLLIGGLMLLSLLLIPFLRRPQAESMSLS